MSTLRETHTVHLTEADLEKLKKDKVLRKLVWEDDEEIGTIQTCVEVRLSDKGSKDIEPFGHPSSRKNSG